MKLPIIRIYDGDKIAASRVEAWEFLVGGGAAFMQLNGLYSTFNPGAAGTENYELLGQLRTLKNFMYSFDFFRMHQDTSFLAGGYPPVLLHGQSVNQVNFMLFIFIILNMDAGFGNRWKWDPAIMLSRENTGKTWFLTLMQGHTLQNGLILRQEL